MIDEYRRPHAIQKELSYLQELIRENKELILTYPDDYALKLNLKSLINREENILKELKLVYNRLQMETFDIVLDGDQITGNSIILSFFGKIASIFQEITTSITESLSKEPLTQDILEQSRFNFIGVGSGSFRIILSTTQPAIAEPLSMKSLRSFNELLYCGENRENIKEQIEILGIKTIIKYKNLLNTLYKNNSDITFYDKMRPQEFKTITISSSVAKKIYDVISKAEEIPDKTFTYKGVLKGISFFSFTFEFLIDESQEKIKGKFNKSLSSDVKNNFDKISIAKFRLASNWNEVTEKEKKNWELLEFIQSN